MEHGTLRLSRIELLEADIDTRIIELCTTIAELRDVSPQLFRRLTIASYRQGEHDVLNEFNTSNNLITSNGYRAYRIDKLPIWHLVDAGEPSDQEVADYIKSRWNEENWEFEWPQDRLDNTIAHAYIRTSYGLGYCVGAHLLAFGK